MTMMVSRPANKYHCRSLVFIILQSCLSILLVSSISCSDYFGGKYPSNFCSSTACSTYCKTQDDPESCMDTLYVSPGYCTKKSVNPTEAEKCKNVLGVKPEWTNWCQTTACTMAQDSCRASGSTSCALTEPDWIMQYFPMFCKQAKTELGGNSCFAHQSWTASARCALCSNPSGESCPEFHWTKCYSTLDSCIKEGREEECWAFTTWRKTDCALCPHPQDNHCPAFHWTDCFPTERDCINACGSNCKKICPKNTLGLTRPAFDGPSCYNDKYGKQFGPHWIPTGKTRFEHYVKDPTQLYVMLQTTDDDLPWLENQWKPMWSLKGCDAAAAVYENIVCAIEILTVLGKPFVGPKSGAPGNKITDFLNNGDQQVDLRELAAFFSQSWKEVARMQVWEEAPSTGYADCVVYPCGTSLYYQGRGPVQLSWNYNYGPFSEWFYGDKYVLLNDPDKVDPEGPMGFIAYFWFWFTPRDFTSGQPISGSIRMRDAIVHWTDGKMNGIYQDGKDYDSVAGLGLSTNVVNGGVECPAGHDGPLWRIAYFLTAAGRLGAKIPDMNDQAGCLKDKYCNGLFSGCTASAKGATCQSKTDICGPRYVDGWTTNLCNARP